LYGLARLRILAGARATVALHEGTEADQGDTVLAVQRTGDFVEHGIEDAVGLLPSQVSLFRNGCGEFWFAHTNCLLDGVVVVFSVLLAGTAPKAPQRLYAAAVLGEWHDTLGHASSPIRFREPMTSRLRQNRAQPNRSGSWRFRASRPCTSAPVKA